MINHFELKEITGTYFKTLYKFFKVNNINHIWDYNMWIAGGFARIIGESIDNNENLNRDLYLYLHEQLGDIDIFSSSKERLEKFVKENIRNNDCLMQYNSQFAYNIETNRGYKIQFVDKFFYDSYEECLSNFDFTNCKYLIYKKEDKFFLLKDVRAKDYNNNKIINIDKCFSPLLGYRIIKYINKHKFKKLSNSPECVASLKEFLYKSISESWCDTFIPLKCSGEYVDITKNYLPKLHNIINLSSEDLSLFIGKFNIKKYEKIQSSYGFYVKEIGSVDWASNEIRNKDKQRF